MKNLLKIIVSVITLSFLLSGCYTQVGVMEDSDTVYRGSDGNYYAYGDYQDQDGQYNGKSYYDYRYEDGYQDTVDASDTSSYYEEGPNYSEFSLADKDRIIDRDPRYAGSVTINYMTPFWRPGYRRFYSSYFPSYYFQFGYSSYTDYYWDPFWNDYCWNCIRPPYPYYYYSWNRYNYWWWGGNDYYSGYYTHYRPRYNTYVQTATRGGNCDQTG